MSYEFPGKGKVAILKTTPESVLTDLGEVMNRAGYRDALKPDLATILKVNISWDAWFPGISTTPWQLEGVVRQLRSDAFERLIAVHNDNPAFDTYAGERHNKLKYVVDKYGVEDVHLYEPHVEWMVFEPKTQMLVLHDIYPEGIRIPRMFIGKNIVHLSTVRPDSNTLVAGAAKSACLGLLKHRSHWISSAADMALVDSLAIQQEIHPGTFAVMDGTFAAGSTQHGNFPIASGDILIASADQVAIDAVSACLQGVDPMEVGFIKLAHELGIGVGSPKEIEIVDHDISLEEARKSNWNAIVGSASSVVTRSDEGETGDLQRQTLPDGSSSNVPSMLFNRAVWAPFTGRSRAKEALETNWGRLFKSYDDGRAVLPGPDPKSAGIALAGMVALFTILALVLSRLIRR